tara:strand:- start:10831 stop:12102 length:1272 start_codon:yes stop_codon:yes gene_type:complete
MEQITDIAEYMLSLGENSKEASRVLAKVTTKKKNAALLAMKDSLSSNIKKIKKENDKDLALGKERKLDAALLDRLELNDKRINDMIESIDQIASLPDPIGEIFDLKYRPSGIQVGRMRAPLGVIGIVYESRPNVTADAAALCLKSGNASILRGGSEAFFSNQSIAYCIDEALNAVNLPPEIVQVVKTIDRDAVGKMITMSDYIDVIIPRGGKSLIERISSESTIPVIKHLDGICHVYIDKDANLSKAFDVALNAKTQRYGTCNTMETLLVNKLVADAILPKLSSALLKEGVEIRGCPSTKKILGDSCKLAKNNDWETEYLAPILSIKVVKDTSEAIDHINAYGSSHTDSIISENIVSAHRFLREVDSSSVMVNASTRFADGFEYGLGAEVGISTDKFHARGPVGLEGLTSVKFIVFGDGHIRE